MNKEILVPFQALWIKLQGFILWTEPCRIHTAVERNLIPGPNETIPGSSKEFLSHMSQKTFFVKVLFSVFSICVMYLWVVWVLTTSEWQFFTSGQTIKHTASFSSGKLFLKSIEAGIFLALVKSGWGSHNMTFSDFYCLFHLNKISGAVTWITTHLFKILLCS